MFRIFGNDRTSGQTRSHWSSWKTSAAAVLLAFVAILPVQAQQGHSMGDMEAQKAMDRILPEDVPIPDTLDLVSVLQVYEKGHKAFGDLELITLSTELKPRTLGDITKKRFDEHNWELTKAEPTPEAPPLTYTFRKSDREISVNISLDSDLDVSLWSLTGDFMTEEERAKARSVRPSQMPKLVPMIEGGDVIALDIDHDDAMKVHFRHPDSYLQVGDWFRETLADHDWSIQHPVRLADRESGYYAFDAEQGDEDLTIITRPARHAGERITIGVVVYNWPYPEPDRPGR